MLKLLIMGALTVTALVIPSTRSVNVLHRQERDSIGQNRLANNLYAYKRGRNRSDNMEMDLIRSIAQRFSTYDLTNDQRMMLKRINNYSTLSNRHVNRNFNPVIDLSKLFL